METTVKMLTTYYGRDKIVRTVSYAAMLLAGTSQGKSAKNWGTIAKQLSAARTVLRLFDDLLMLANTLKYGLGSKERDPVIRILTLLGNAANQLFFPVEHVAWLADNDILPIQSSNWWTAGIGLWATSLTAGILKNLRNIGRIRRKRVHLLKQKKMESPDPSSESGRQFNESIVVLGHEEMVEYITLVKNVADLLNAVSWLPKGFLWAGKLSLAQQGLFGLISSLALIAISLITMK